MLISIAACGTEATVVPSVTMTRSTSHAAPPPIQVNAVEMTGTWTFASTSPTTDATALNSIATGTNGTTRTLAIGATSERRSKLTRITGNVVSCAASVNATGSRSQPGQPARRRSTDAPNQTRPPVASSDS
jgi:hypothetical protein